ncbi:hypothetical protein BCR32DRAFT_290282 [Anaeromyces robustus]|uniref:Vps53 N-terminal domain-containing protein n=1 Tax=Anaeromyces robustus TaxID=1754192 RepID=A0A1Y1XK06_9FUNG|nr:hypothetical protein BCR32DRAFT_290282 [Anaeromyces robustus]|eukprot:ORX86055.1 hypothetical protein BCR32DRAFT_290282 [Anaeromyces robustus]
MINNNKYNELFPKEISEDDPLNQQDFDVVSYINKIFPHEQSLASIDNVLADLKSRINQLDKDIRDLLRTQTDAGQQAFIKLEETKKLITQLYDRLQNIKLKANNSERLVQDITKDIKSLDYAKTHLTISITVLKRLQMLGLAITQIKNMISTKQYKETAQLLDVIYELLKYFSTYRSISQIDKLYVTMNSIQNTLKSQIFNEFEYCFSQEDLTDANVSHLNDACLVIEKMQNNEKKELIDWYCKQLLQEYESIFRANDEITSVDSITQRYSWLKQNLRRYDEDHSKLFPKEWEVGKYLCSEFCDITREGLVLALEKSKELNSQMLLQIIQYTTNFETKLEKRFNNKNKNINGQVDYSFKRSISSCFEDFLHIYTNDQEKAISSMLNTYRMKPILENDESAMLLGSGTELYMYYRQALNQLSKMSNTKPLFDLYNIFGKYLLNYSSFMSSKLPKDDRKTAVENEIRICTLILNTSDYCYTTTSQLQSRVIELIDTKYKEKIDFSNQQDSFMNTITSSIKSLVRTIELLIDPYMITMAKINWSNIESVGDQSNYVTEIGNNIFNYIKKIKENINNNRYFKVFVDKFTESFLIKYLNNIYKCKPISTVGAEQLLLDILALKSIIQKIPNINKDKDSKQTSSTSFVKILNSGINKIESLLKVIMIPTDPADALFSNYELLYGENCNYTNLQKILELKGLKRSEQQPLLDRYEKKCILRKAKNKEILGETQSVKTNSNSNSSTKISAMNIISNIVGQTPNQLSNSISSASSTLANTFIPKHLLINKSDTDKSLSANGPMSASVLNSGMPPIFEGPRRGSSGGTGYMLKHEVNFSNSDSAPIITKQRTTSFSSPAPYTTTKSQTNKANHLNILTNVNNTNSSSNSNNNNINNNNNNNNSSNINSIENFFNQSRRNSTMSNSSASSMERTSKLINNKKSGFNSNTSSPTSNKLMMMNEKISKWIKRDL